METYFFRDGFLSRDLDSKNRHGKVIFPFSDFDCRIWTWSQGAHPGAIAKLLPPFVANVTSKVDASALLSLMGFTSPTDGGQRSVVSAHEMQSIQQTVRCVLSEF